MLRSLLLLVILGTIGCSPVKETLTVVNGTNGKDGTSCSVSDYTLDYSDGDSKVIGALITCTDGSRATVLNGTNGANGVQGAAGPQGTTGPQGAAGEAGKDGNSCLVARGNSQNYVVVQCGDNEVVINDGEDGSDGSNGENGSDGSNGTDGQDGQDGANGSTALFSSILLTSSCKVIDGNNSAKLNGGSGEVKLYSTNNCSGSSVSIHDGEVAVTSNNSLVINVENTDSIKLLTFSN